MKIKLLENHQLPKDSSYIFSNQDIKKIFNNLIELSVFKSNHPYTFDKSYHGKEPKIKGCVISTLSYTVHDNIFFHLYGCQKEILETISKNDIENMIIPKLQIWLEQLTGINKKIPKHRMLIVEIDSGRLKFHELGK